MKALTSKKGDWHTPQWIVDLAWTVLGRVDLDPASDLIANERIKATKIYTKEDNGLVQPWYGNVFLNPPGERSGKLTEAFWLRAVAQVGDGQVDNVFYVGFNLNQLARFWYPGDAYDKTLARWPTCVLRQRVSFLNLGGKPVKQPANHSFLTLISRNLKVRGEFLLRCAEYGVMLGL